VYAITIVSIEYKLLTTGTTTVYICQSKYELYFHILLRPNITNGS